MLKGSNVYYYSRDGLGSITDITDSSGNVVESYTYDAFGQVSIFDANHQPLTTSQIGNSYYFTGREFDFETGLYYYRARWYDPELGRFLTTDPIEYEAGVNLYTYVGNNPVNWVDPWGLARELIRTYERTREIYEGHEKTIIELIFYQYWGANELVPTAVGIYNKYEKIYRLYRKIRETINVYRYEDECGASHIKEEVVATEIIARWWKLISSKLVGTVRRSSEMDEYGNLYFPEKIIIRK